ncbi:cell division control dna repair exonuclease [Fusarium sporotrichioides]|uniref:Cell division control dna repair exonuclease n=1 Tax=Fusarium sporotrichioides TaxID=5514 RepID=A0A395STD9_FUSSP|nr:cell division control dna repair exonuclease [Fusarium sporotrichioides]
MNVVAFLRHGLRLLVPLSVAFTLYLYLFPVIQGCAFPVESRDSHEAYSLTKKLHWPSKPTADDHAKLAPFRLLALGDPQLEGDTSIITNYLGTFPHIKSAFKKATFQTSHWCFRERVRQIIHDIVDVFMEDLPYWLMSQRKRFDLWGNDFYLAHIYRQVNWWTNPTHVSVLGDLVGSQWIDDNEFEKRGRRFWNRVFKGTERLSDELAKYPNLNYTVSGVLDGSEEQKAWKKRMLNVAGNHDIGYAGDLTEERLERFERVFGKTNYELRFELPITDPETRATLYSDENPDSTRVIPSLRIIGVNDMNLDTPAKSLPLQDATYGFINNVIATSGAVQYKGEFTLILTHIPMYKPEGICVDAPLFDFHTAADGGGLKEQNQLSVDATRGFLEGMWGMSAKSNGPGNGYGRPGLMLNGHDHAGCDTYHYINQTNGTDPSERSWQVATWSDAQAQQIPGSEGIPGRREITVRSMMGDFGGNAGLLSLWFDQETWEWKFEYATCPLGNQVFWWFTHIWDVCVVVWVALYAVLSNLEARGVDVDGRFYSGAAMTRDFVLRRRRREEKKTATKE